METHAEDSPSTALPLLYVDEGILVLDKAAGLLAVSGRGPEKQDCLSSRVQAVYPDALVVHRLDMSTSGLMVMALGIDAQRRLNAAFAQRRVFKRYTAVVAGPMRATGPGVWSTIQLPIRADWERRPVRVIDPAAGKPSITRWRLLESNTLANTTRVSLEPLTGRSHQLRVHLQALGHPILGDALYGSGAIARAAPRLLLHATVLAFRHPLSGRAMGFESPPDF